MNNKKIFVDNYDFLNRFYCIYCPLKWLKYDII